MENIKFHEGEGGTPNDIFGIDKKRAVELAFIMRDRFKEANKTHSSWGGALNLMFEEIEDPMERAFLVFITGGYHNYCTLMENMDESTIKRVQHDIQKEAQRSREQHPGGLGDLLQKKFDSEELRDDFEENEYDNG